MLTGQCRRVRSSKVYPTFHPWKHILGVSRKLPRRTDHRKLPSKSNLKRTCSLPCLRSLQFIVYRGNFSWPFKLIMKCLNVADDEQLRTYRPSSDFILLQSKLPRLLVEVNSKPKSDWPEDLVGMLVMGAAVVHFANTIHS